MLVAGGSRLTRDERGGGGQAALKRTKAVLASQNPNRPAAQRKRTARPVQHGDDE